MDNQFGIFETFYGHISLLWNPIYMPKIRLQVEKWGQTCGAAVLLELEG